MRKAFSITLIWSSILIYSNHKRNLYTKEAELTNNEKQDNNMAITLVTFSE